MSVARKTWISALVVGALLLSAFPYFVMGDATRPAPSGIGEVELQAGAGESTTPTGETQETPVPWSKIDPSLRDRARAAGKGLVEVSILASDAAELAVALQKWGAERHPELALERDAPPRRDVMSLGLPSGHQVSAGIQVLVPEAALGELASLPGVVSIDQPPFATMGLDESLDLELMRDRVEEFRDTRLDDANLREVDEWGIVKVHDIDDVWTDPNLGYTGTSVNVAVYDTGVDFAHPNLVGTWATVTDPASPWYGWPIAFDWDSMDLMTLTNTAGSDYDRAPYPIFYSFGESSWYADTSYQAQAAVNGTIHYSHLNTEYGVLQFSKRANPNGYGAPADMSRIDRYYYVGDILDPNRINSASGWYHVGVSKDDTLTTYWGTRVGLLVTDSTTPFVYDTVYVDMNFNMDFTDDKPATQADPVVAWDMDFDGFYDLSSGIIHFISNTTSTVVGETVIAGATGTETGANLAGDHIVMDIFGFDLQVTLVLYQDGVYWPSSTETIWEVVVADTTGLGDETGTTSQLTAGTNANTGAAVDTFAVLADYDLSFVYDIYNSSGSLAEGADYSIDLSTGEITWLVDFPDGDFVEIMYQFDTWTVDFSTGVLTFSAPPLAGATVTADYQTGVGVGYSDTFAASHGFDNFIPASGDLVAMHGAYDTSGPYWHGTAVASHVAGNPVGNFFGILDIFGGAPDAKVISVHLASVGPDEIADNFGFIAAGYDGVRGTGGDDANVASNSWGYIAELRNGFHWSERILYDLLTTQAQDLAVLFSAGNEGPGYGNSAPMGSGPGAITVGASLIMNYRWLFGSDGGPCYDWVVLIGSCPIPFGDVVDFSARGPTLLGTPEPDVLASGAYALGAMSLNYGCASWGCGGLDAWDLWGGTSMSSPVAASVVALIYDAYNDVNGMWPSGQMAKNILMSSANDHGYDVLQQGAGVVNGSRAAYIASGQAGILSDTPFWTPGGYQGVNRPAFVNFATPGTPDSTAIALTNYDTAAASVTLSAAMYDKVAPDFVFTWDNVAPWAARDWRILKATGLYDADGVTLLDPTDISAGWNAADFLQITFERDPTILGGTPYTYIETFDWFNYARDVGGEFVAESTVTTETGEILVIGFLGETKGYTANTPVLPGTYVFYRNAVPLIEGVDYTFDVNTGLVTLLGPPLADGEILSGDYDWYVPVLAPQAIPLSWTYIMSGTETVWLNGMMWDSGGGANWTIDFLNGVFNLWVDLNPGDLVEIDYTYNTPMFESYDERSRTGWWGVTPGQNIVTAQVHHPATQIHDGLAISFRDVNSLLGPTQITVSFYGSDTHPWMSVSPGTLNIGPGATESFTATVDVPVGTAAGSYQAAIKADDGTSTVVIPVLINILYTGFPAFVGGGVPANSLYDMNSFLRSEKCRDCGDARFLWADVGALTAGDNRQMIFDLFWTREESDMDMGVLSQVPDDTYTDDAIYGPSTFALLAETKWQDGVTDTIRNDAEILKAPMTGGILGIVYRAFTATAFPEPFSADVGYMQTDPIVLDVETNQLAGSRPVSVTANVDLVDGLGAAVTETISDAQIGVWVDPFPFPGGDFLTYLYNTRNVNPTSVHMTFVPPDTISAAWEVPFYGTASDIDVGIFHEAANDPGDCTGSYGVSDGAAIGTSMSTGNNPERGALKFPPAGCYWVHLAGYTVGAPGPQADIMFDVLKIGAGAFQAANVPSTTIPAYTPSTFDIAWDFPGSTSEHSQSSALLVSPGYAPFALVQPIDIAFTYDTTPPGFLGESPADGAVISDAGTSVLVGISDPPGGLDPASAKMWLDGVEVTDLVAVSAPWDDGVDGRPIGALTYAPPEPLGDGMHSAVAMISDVAGNEATFVWSFTVDTTAPSLALTAPADGLITTSATVTVSGITEPGATVSIGGGTPFTAGTADGTFSGTYTLDEGANMITVTATDGLGHQSSTSVMVHLDSSVPVIGSIANSAGALTRDASTTLSGTVSADAQLWINGQGVVVNADGSWSATVALVEGTNTIDITAVDAAGNSASTQLTITRDSAPPVITLSAFPALIQERAQCDRAEDVTDGYVCYVTLDGTVDDSGALVFINGNPSGSGGTFSREFALNYGSNDFTVTAVDGAGNAQQISASVSFTPQAVQVRQVYTTVLLMALAVVLLVIGLFIGMMLRRKPGAPPEEMPPEEEPLEMEEEEMPPPPEEEMMEAIEEEEDLFELEELEEEPPAPPAEEPPEGPSKGEEGEEL